MKKEIIWLILLTILIFWIYFVPQIFEVYRHLFRANPPISDCENGKWGWKPHISWDWIYLKVNYFWSCPQN